MPPDRKRYAPAESRTLEDGARADNVTTSGYSSAPLAKKLGIKPGHTVVTVNEPEDLRRLLGDAVGEVAVTTRLDQHPDVILAFYTTHAALESDLDKLAREIFPDRVIWYAWPKQSAGMVTDLRRDLIRETVLDRELVDIKICAISDTWSGLKVMWRREHR